MVRPATLNDCRALAQLAARMWDHDAEELAADFADLINSGSAACFLQYVDDTPIGFAQCSLRTDYVEGTSTSPVGYLEGVYIEEPFRKSGTLDGKLPLSAGDQALKPIEIGLLMSIGKGALFTVLHYFPLSFATIRWPSLVQIFL